MISRENDVRHSATMPTYDNYGLKNIPDMRFDEIETVVTSTNPMLKSIVLPDALVYSDWAFSKLGSYIEAEPMPIFVRSGQPAETERQVATYRMYEEIYLNFERFGETPDLQYAAKAACAGRCIGKNHLDITIAAIIDNTDNNYSPRSLIGKCERCGQCKGWFHNVATITMSRKMAVSYSCEPIRNRPTYPTQLYQDKRISVTIILLIFIVLLLLPLYPLIYHVDYYQPMGIDVTSLLSLMFLLETIVMSYIKQQVLGIDTWSDFWAMRKIAEDVESADKTFENKRKRDDYIVMLMTPGYSSGGLLKGAGTSYFDCDHGSTGMKNLITETDAWMSGTPIIMDRYDMTIALPTGYSALGSGIGIYREYKIGYIGSDGILHFDKQNNVLYNKSMRIRLGNLYIG